MTNMSREGEGRFVLVTEVGTRDGFQSEKEFIPTEVKAELVNALIDAGVTSIEATSFVSPRAVPQLADASQVMDLIHRRPGVRITALVPNARGAERAAAAKVDMMACFISASEIRKRVRCGLSLANMLPPPVESYILQKSLYQEDRNRTHI